MSAGNTKIAWWTPRCSEIEKKNVADVIDSDYLNEGDVTAAFEEQLAKRLGCKYAVAATSGTASLFLSLAALGIGPGDEVIVPDMTFIATANSVYLSGAKPVLVDVDPNTLNISPAAIKKSLTDKTKAIIPVHVSGRAADLSSILGIAKEHDLHVVEDAAEAFMSKSNGKFLGTVGDLGILSFSPNKTITTGQGGAVLVNNEDLYVRLKELKDQGRPARGTGGADIHNSVGFNFKMTNLQAAVGLGQLSSLEARVKRMIRNYEMYTKDLTGVSGVHLLPFDISGGEVPQWTDGLFDRRDELHQYLQERNMDCRKFWFPLHTQLPYKQDDQNFPVSTDLSKKAMWLPSAFTLSDEDVGAVCAAIKEFYG